MNPIEVKARYEPYLLKIPGVVGVGATDKFIIVYFKDMSHAHLVPDSIEGVPVVKVWVGRVWAA